MNLNNDIDLDFKRFFHWWGHELSYFIPERIKQKFSDSSGIVYLHASHQRLNIFRLIDDQEQPIAQLEFDESSQENFQSILENHPELNTARFILRLESGQAIKKILYLPAAAKENMLQVIAFEMNRFTPFSIEQVYYDAKVLAKEEGGFIKVLLVVTPKEVLDALYLRLVALKIFPDVVEFDEVPNNFEADIKLYNLLPDGERPKKNKLTSIMIGGLVVVLLLLIVVVFAYPMLHEREKVRELREQLHALERDALLVHSHEAEIENLVSETEGLITIKRDAPSLTELMNNLSLLLNDETWLSHMQFRDGQLQIQGQSPTASTLIGLLEASPMFSDARFVSPLTQDKRSGLERFQISVQVVADGKNDEK